MSETPDKQQHKPASRPGLLSVMQSVLAAMVGIQSDEKRQQDFEQGHPATYIFVGVLFVILFILVVISIVNGILNDAGLN